MTIKNLILLIVFGFSPASLATDTCSTMLASVAQQIETKNHLINLGYDSDVATRIVEHAGQKIINQIVNSNYLIPKTFYRGVNVELSAYNPTFTHSSEDTVYFDSTLGWPMEFAKDKGVVLKFQLPAYANDSGTKLLRRRPNPLTVERFGEIPDDRLFLLAIGFIKPGLPTTVEWVSYREAVERKLISDF